MTGLEALKDRGHDGTPIDMSHIPALTTSVGSPNELYVPGGFAVMLISAPVTCKATVSNLQRYLAFFTVGAASARYFVMAGTKPLCFPVVGL